MLLFQRLPNLPFLLVQQSPARELLFPEEEQADQPALLVDADFRELVGEILSDELGVDGAVDFVDDADFLEFGEDGAGVLLVFC